MSEVTKERTLLKALYYMMHLAFVEIRSSRSLNASKKFADVFHGLPMRLFYSSSTEEDENIYADLLERSRRYGMESYIENLKDLAIKSVK